jgi:hypothetical protein
MKARVYQLTPHFRIDNGWPGNRSEDGVDYEERKAGVICARILQSLEKSLHLSNLTHAYLWPYPLHAI